MALLLVALPVAAVHPSSGGSMANPFTGYGMPSVDFSPFGRLGEVYKKAKIEGNRELSLADLANGGSYGDASRKLLTGGDFEGALTLAKIAEAQGGKATDEIREYNLAVSQGEKRNFTDWKSGLKRAGATNVNVNTGDKAYDTKVHGAYGERFIESQKAGQNAGKTIGTLNLMEKLIDTPGFYSGTGGEVVTTAKRALSSAGLADPNAASSAELFGSLANQTVLDASGGSLGNQISNADRDFIMRTAPSLGNTPEGNRDLINMRRKLAQREQETAMMARNYAKRNGRLDSGFDDELSDFIDKNPLFPQPKARTPVAPREMRGTMTPGDGGKPLNIAIPQRPSGVPDGSGYSPGQKMWFTRDGQAFDETGRRVR